MRLGSLFQVAFFFVVAIMVFTLCVNFVDGLGVFSSEGTPIYIDKGLEAEGNASDVFASITGLDGGMQYVWGLGITLAALGSVALAWATGQTTPIGVYIFSAVFWTSWIRCFSIFETIVPTELTMIAHIIMLFIFAGAIAGVLSGGG